MNAPAAGVLEERGKKEKSMAAKLKQYAPVLIGRARSKRKSFVTVGPDS